MPSLLSALEHERLARPHEADELHVRMIADRLVDEAGTTEPPVNVELIASLVDIAEIIESDLNVSGCLIPSDNRSKIMVRCGEPKTRQRFTICHECAHTFFPGFKLTTQFRCAPTPAGHAQPDLERLCDVAASEILLPRRLLHPLVMHAEPSLETVRDLAAEFDASLLATAIAIAELSDQPAAVLTFEVMQKPSEYGTYAAPKLRLKSAIRSGDWPYFIRHKSATKNDPFDRASQGEIVTKQGVLLEGIVPSPITVDVWAEPAPYTEGLTQRERVIALLRRSDAGASRHA